MQSQVTPEYHRLCPQNRRKEKERGRQGRLPSRGESSRSEECLLAPTGMQGSTPLDVAAASVIDNNELALALQEHDLEKVCGRSLALTWGA